MLPQILEEVFQILTQSFGQRDGICIALECSDLTPPIYLAMRKLSNFSVAALMQKVELLNSQNRFKIDSRFGIHISRTVIPSGGGKRKLDHTEVDRKRFAHSIVTISVGDNIYLLSAFFLGKYRFTHDVSLKGKDAVEWRNMMKKLRPKTLEWMARQIVMDGGLTVCEKLDVDYLKIIQNVGFPWFQVRVTSTQNRYAPIAQFPGAESHCNERDSLTTRQ